MVFLEQASFYFLFHLWCSWIRPAVISCSTYSVPGAGQLLFPVPLMVFLEQASCYFLFHLWCFWIRPAVISCSTYGAPGAGQLLSLSPLILFLIARAAFFSPRNFISCPGHYLILSKDWRSDVPAPGERIQGAAK
jgi:hypothetical protein